MNSNFSRYLDEMATEFRPPNLVKSLSAGVTLYIAEIFVVISFAALIFNGELAGQISYGVGFIVGGDSVICLMVALFSSYRGSVAIEQDAPGAILALMAASLVAALPVALRSQQAFPTVVVMIVGASLATGLFFILLGVFKLGGLARYLPYPVLGGFLAGTGWLLAAGGVQVMINPPLDLAWFQPAILLRWLPGLIIGILIYFVTVRFKNALALPLSFLAAVGLFYLSSWLAGISIAQLEAGGWLLGPFPQGGLWMFPLSPAILSQVNWGALADKIPDLAPLLFISRVLSRVEVLYQKGVPVWMLYTFALSLKRRIVFSEMTVPVLSPAMMTLRPGTLSSRNVIRRATSLVLLGYRRAASKNSRMLSRKRFPVRR